MDILAIITQEVKEIFSCVVSDASVSLERLESEVLRASRELSQKVLEACVSQRASQEVSVSVACRICAGESCRFRFRERYVETLCGVCVFLGGCIAVMRVVIMRCRGIQMKV